MKREYADLYSAYEKNHWWFRARRKILRSLLQREIAWQEGQSVLEIGVGPGENLYSLYPSNVRLTGLEPDENNARIARQRGPLSVFTGTIENLPVPIREQQFDVITLFDVLEHIEDDLAALDIIAARFKKGGRLAMTVPAYQWMWGQQDVVNLHFRRYTLGELQRKLIAKGFRITRATYFNTLLFPPIALVRLLARLKPGKSEAARSDFEYNTGAINELLFHIFAAEASLTQYISFPFGVSIFVVAECPPAKVGEGMDSK